MKEHPLGTIPQNMTMLIRGVPMGDDERIALMNVLEVLLFSAMQMM